MRPRGAALAHPAAHLLEQYATTGCPSDFGADWTPDMWDAAIEYGNHLSAEQPLAAAALVKETLDKVETGDVTLINWNDIKDNPPKRLKISPLAAIPHKSRLFRAILDLSHALTVNGTTHLSVNDFGTSHAVHQAMDQLGQVLPRFIATMANIDPSQGPVLFTKFDIKDGFWRMTVEEGEEWNFVYLLPRLNQDDPIVLVLPKSLQMGWTDSPPFFCTATETARDIATDNIKNGPSTLPPHPFEDLTLPAPWRTHKGVDAITDFAHLLEVYVDDFCVLAQTNNPTILRGLSRTILHAIHDVFPPPEETGHSGGDPISLKKLLAGEGVWAVQKEILGWMFDGISFCISLPAKKITDMIATLHQLRRQPHILYKDLEKLRGRMIHATIGIPDGRPLLAPLNRALVHKRKRIRNNPALISSMRDFASLLREMAKHPTHVKQLVTGPPAFICYCDASKIGVGGVLLPGKAHMPPTVWHVPFPPDIQNQFWSADNPSGTITNSDLELLGIVYTWIILEYLADLHHLHIGVWCDNTPSVGWARKLCSNRSIIAEHLTRVLAIRHRITQSSPLITSSIRGIHNTMADIPSRAFGTGAIARKYAGTPHHFLTQFNSTFPLPQQQSWRLFQPTNKLNSRFFSLLLKRQLTPESWQRLPENGGSIGNIGSASPPTMKWTPCSKMSHESIKPNYSKHTLNGSGQVITVESIVSELKQSRSRSEPLERPSKWLCSTTHATVAPTATSNPSNDK